MPNPTLTFEMSPTMLFAIDDPVAAMATLAALVVASTDWRVIAGGDGVTDDYLEIGGEAGGPISNERLLFTGTSGALPAPDAVNKGIEKGATSQGNWWYACYAPDDGRTANAWDSALPLYTNRNTGLMAVGSLESGDHIDRVRIYSSEEVFILMWGDDTGTAWSGCIGGAHMVPTREADGEADGRLRGLSAQFRYIQFTFWNSTTFRIFCSDSPSINAVGKAVIFDPEDTDTLLKVVYSPFLATGVDSNVSLTQSGEVHMAPLFVNTPASAASGANASQLSVRSNLPEMDLIIGHWRQLRQGPDRQSELVIFDAPPASVIITYTLGADKNNTNDTLYVDQV